jgi:small subunit ribosomal protein S15Ae
LLAGYIGEFEIVDDHRSGKIVVQLNGRLNKTGVISPRYNVQATQIEAWVNLLLPARGFGKIILVRELRLIKFDRVLTGP